jgi:inorganic pyrophosphatase
MSRPNASRRAVHVVVETPAGSRNKYRYDESTRSFLLHKVLPLGTSFPFDFGFVPETRAEDGDPIDVIVLGGEPTFPGCVVPARILGVIEAEQREKGKRTIRNDRLVATAETAKIRPVWEEIGDVPADLLDRIERFFVSYNEAEGRVFRPLGRRGSRAAEKSIREAARAFREG